MFISNIKSNNSKLIYLFDIDNTLADTWPCYYVPYQSYGQRLLSLPVFRKMRTFILSKYKEGHVIIFVSARNYKGHDDTFRWLKSIEIPCTKNNVIIVSRPEEKVELIKLATQKHHCKICLVDDLSYNHENGEPKFYKEVINQIIHIPDVTYLGISEISQIHQHADSTIS